MHPVLASQEIRVIELRRRQFQAGVERDRCLRERSSGSHHVILMNQPAPKSMSVWVRSVGIWVASLKPRPASAVGEEATGVPN